MNFSDFLQSLLELLRRKFEFAFIKYSKFDVSKVSLSFCFSSLLESAFYQNLRILDINFSANVIYLLLGGEYHRDADAIH